MNKENTVLTIDIGSDSLKMAEFLYPTGGTIILTKFAFRKLVPGDDAVAEFERVYREMLSDNDFTSRSVRVSISGQSSFCRLSKLPPLLGNQAVIDRIVEYEARQIVPYAMKEVVWEYQLIKHGWQETRNETLEDGTVNEYVDEHEEYEALFVAVKNEYVSRITDVIEDSGKKVLWIDIAPVALFNAAKATQCRDDECVLLLNIGGCGTNLMIADHNRVFIRSIPIAGDIITQQVAKEFGISFEEAEELKHRHCFVALGGAYEEPESEVGATISKIARNVMIRLHGEVSRSINVWCSQHGGNAPERILLSGGSSAMMYVSDFFYEKLRLPIAYLNTFSAIQLADTVDRLMLQAVAPMFQEMIGMSLRQVTTCPINVSLVANSTRNQRELDKKKPYFYVAAGMLLVCLAIFAFGVNMRLEFDRTRVEKAAGRVTAVNQQMKRVDGLYSQLTELKSRYEEASEIFRNRDSWMRMLDELASKMPDNMWLVSLEGVSGDGTVARRAIASPFGAIGTGDEGGASQEAADNANIYMPTVSPITLQQVDKLRLIGYTVITDRPLLEREFQRVVKNSEFFEEEEPALVSWTQESDNLNISSFEMLVTLREPVTK